MLGEKVSFVTPCYPFVTRFFVSRGNTKKCLFSGLSVLFLVSVTPVTPILLYNSNSTIGIYWKTYACTRVCTRVGVIGGRGNGVTRVTQPKTALA